MKEKFSDYEGSGFLSEEGTFVFTIESAELKQGKEYPYCELSCKSDAGKTTVRHSLNPKARWSYNNLIKACLKLTKEQIKTFELDYETIGQELVGTSFVGTVESDTYQKEVRVPLDDGTFDVTTETKTSYKIVAYEELQDDLPF